MYFLPYRGAAQKMRTNEATMLIPVHTRKPTDKKSFWNARMDPVSWPAGPLRAMMTDPMTQRKQPILPKSAGRMGGEGVKLSVQPVGISHGDHPGPIAYSLNFSLRKIELKTAHSTTLNAPNGVTKMAGAKAYATKLKTSPMIMMSIPVHHKGLLRYCIPSPAVVEYFF